MLRIFAKHFFYMNYEIDQTKLTERILTIVKAVGVIAGLYVFLTFVIIFLLYTLGFIQMTGSTEALFQINTPEGLEQLLAQNSTEIIILNLLISIVLHFLLSGIYGIIIKSATSPFIGLGDAFKLLFTGRGFKVLLYIILAQIIITSINYFFSFYDLAMVGFAIGALIQFLTYFTPLLIYVENSNFFKAISESIHLINSKPLFFIPVVLFSYMISLSGVLLFGIGIIFTLPINFIMAYSLYSIIKESRKSSEIES